MNTATTCTARGGEYQDIHDHARRIGIVCEACEVPADSHARPSRDEERMFRAEGRM